MADPRSCTVLYKAITPDTFNTLVTATPSTAFTDPSSSSLAVCTSKRLPLVLEALETSLPSLTTIWVLAVVRNERINAQLSWDDEEGCGRIEGGVDPWEGGGGRARPVQKGPDGKWDHGELEW